MKIVMFTNTYLPHVGGVANSVKTFEDEFRALGHEVKVIAPEFEGAHESTANILRVPAFQNFKGSDFSVRILSPALISDFLDAFDPDIVHSHHPFLLGDAALRAAYHRNLPIVFTHHTLYENYTHYVPLDSPAMKRAAIQLAVEYANLCTAVIAPSESVQSLLEKRGVTTPIRAIPTGIDLKRFRGGDGGAFRQKAGIPATARVIGHVGRLAEEKNLLFLAEAVGRCLRENPEAVALIVGDGDAREATASTLHQWAAPERVIMAGQLTGSALADAYMAMDLFAFSSHSETQGMVLAEAMAAGKPVVALDAPGVREIVRDGENGRLLDAGASPEDFAAALASLLGDAEILRAASGNALRSARNFSKRRCARKILALYQDVVSAVERARIPDYDSTWDTILRHVEIEWGLLAGKLAAVGATMLPNQASEVDLA